MTAALELRNVRCTRGDRVLVAGLSVRCDGGTALRFEGANGAGKTSLLRLIAGLAAPASGEILWRSQPVHRAEGLDDAVYLGHAPALKDELTAVENLQAACALAGRRVGPEAAAAALGLAGLGNAARRPARSLSQGQRRRAVLARLTLAAGDGLWVLDEPFDALDDAAREWLRGAIAAQLGRGGVVVLTSHERGPWDRGWRQTTVRLRAAAGELTA